MRARGNNKHVYARDGNDMGSHQIVAVIFMKAYLHSQKKVIAAFRTMSSVSGAYQAMRIIPFCVEV